jgi:hypothetical protein
MINNGEGWKLINSNITGETSVFPPEIGGKVDFSTEFNKDKRGFKHTFSTNTNGVIPSTTGGFTEVDFTPDAHFGSDPTGWNTVKPRDIPLTRLDEYKFIVEGAVHSWWRGTPSYNTYMGWCFGGWVILNTPYNVYCEGVVRGVEFTSIVSVTNILETMFWIKQHKDGQSLTPGGDEWHRIFYRKGPADPIKNGWFIAGYILGDPNVGETVRVQLSGEKILQLLETLEGVDKIYERNPLFPNNYKAWGAKSFWIEGLNLNNAYFRPVYFALEGGIDLTTSSESTGASVSFYGVYLYHKKKGVIWSPAGSIAEVSIS